MADVLRKMFAKLKIWIAWLWTYLWALWFLLVVFVVYVLRGPLRIGENLTSGELALITQIRLGHRRSKYFEKSFKMKIFANPIQSEIVVRIQFFITLNLDR